ncbi:hypothetical protein FOCG_17045 [Fusarium oxysporum f. sp. radicis-lycopersici 26381]|nr:hypothetical protein FOWG_03247 [Fusarium oxysporum f. sp. lycopersici MN25]EXL40422.1 hypothetical protein FOCG_17045 [Fusarium oxysporum f. sp. radicis-lycopersici 26381]KAH7466203.1 hypothetical protein FOMA001_g15890 [Fusarium oxysporum f. sp. matthiolae]
MQSTIRAGSRTKFCDVLRKSLGDKALATIKSDSDKGNIPEHISKMLSIHNNDASMSTSKYMCTTQRPLPVEIPTSLSPLALQIGFNGKIPRWKKDQTVQFATLSEGYPTRSQAELAAYRLNEAATQWNDYNIGVTFKWVDEVEDAAFVLAYGGDAGTTLAEAFFPNSNDLSTLFVYQRAFQPGSINYLANIFLHELGHVLGLRHEFAAQEGEAVPFGPPNPLSVMSYKFPPQIQESDIASTRAFYEFAAAEIQGLEIQDEIPDN